MFVKHIWWQKNSHHWFCVCVNGVDEIMVLIKNIVAVLRANVKCFFLKIFHLSAFRYHSRLRVFKGTEITLRNKGKCVIGKNVKIDAQAKIASNGGNITLGENVGIGRNNIIVSQESISIGKGTILGPNVLIYDHDHKFDATNGVKVFDYNCKSVVIGDNCWIGANTIILKGTIIGNNCLIGAGSVIKGIFPDGSKIVQKRETENLTGGVK